MSSAPPTENKEKRLPEKVPGFFPLWEQNVMQTFFKTNPDDSIVADLPILAQARSPSPCKADAAEPSDPLPLGAAASLKHTHALYRLQRR